MKQLRLYTLILFLLGSIILTAGNKDIHHVAMWGGVGYSGLVNHSDNAKFIGGGGGLIGVGYEYHWQQLMLSVGPEFRIFSSRDNVTFPYTYDVNRIVDGAAQTKHYTFGEEFHENHVVGQIALPVLIGAQFNYVYFLAGVKLGYTVLGSYSQSGTLTTSLTDEMAYDPEWINMPNHGLLSDQDYSSKGKNNYGFDATLSAEVGVNLNPFLSSAWNKANEKAERPWRMIVALFLDYGLKNLSISENAPMAQPDENEMTTISLHRSDWATSRLNSLLVGVKFTALLQMNKPKKSVLHCLRHSSILMTNRPIQVSLLHSLSLPTTILNVVLLAVPRTLRVSLTKVLQSAIIQSTQVMRDTTTLNRLILIIKRKAIPCI